MGISHGCAAQSSSRLACEDFAPVTGASIRDVAGSTGLSVATASRVVDNVAEPTRTGLLAAAEALNYVLHGDARSRSMRRTGTIGANIAAASSGR